MSIIGNFIDRACRRRPDVMRRVLARPFGNLLYFVTRDEAGEPCGCLVGSTGLEAGAAVNTWDVVFAVERAAHVAGIDAEDAHEVGMAVWYIAARWRERGMAEHEAHARTVGLIKARIARRLAASAPSASAVAQGAG